MLSSGRLYSYLLQGHRPAAAAACRAAEHIATLCDSPQAEADTGAGPGPGSSFEHKQRIFLEMFRRHNSSLRHLEGQIIGARVFKTDKRSVWLDTGFNKPVKFARKALHLSQLLSSTAGGLRTSPEDFRIGDVLQFTIQELETPYGDMRLAVERPIEKDKFARVWQEIRAAMLSNTPVMGRVLNAVNAGFAVGVAGFVAFCPISAMDFLTVTKVGVLQPFQVESMNEARRNVVLQDMRALAQREAFEQRRRQFARMTGGGADIHAPGMGRGPWAPAAQSQRQGNQQG